MCAGQLADPPRLRPRSLFRFRIQLRGRADLPGLQVELQVNRQRLLERYLARFQFALDPDSTRVIAPPVERQPVIEVVDQRASVRRIVLPTVLAVDAQIPGLYLDL